jgi:uncharacterized membrane protein YdjX (TVP38/TMEM64 family)
MLQDDLTISDPPSFFPMELHVHGMEGTGDLEQEFRRQRRTSHIRTAIGIGLAISLIFVILDSFGDRKVEAALLTFLEWVEAHPFEGVLAVIGVYIVATILFVPGSILTLGTGYAFGSACENTALGVILASTVSGYIGFCL